MQTEMWSKVPEFEGYEVSNMGRLRSFKGTGGKHNVAAVTPRILASVPNSKGYLVHSLLSGKVRKTFAIHRLVAEAFVPGRAQGLECSHLDGNKSNCRADNLVWETHKRNMHRKDEHGTSPIGTRNPRCKLTVEQVSAVTGRRNGGESLSSIARAYGVSVATIWQIYHGWSWVSEAVEVDAIRAGEQPGETTGAWNM